MKNKEYENKEYENKEYKNFAIIIIAQVAIE
jgi:hypothetical protein